MEKLKYIETNTEFVNDFFKSRKYYQKYYIVENFGVFDKESDYFILRNEKNHTSCFIEEIVENEIKSFTFFIKKHDRCFRSKVFSCLEKTKENLEKDFVVFFKNVKIEECNFRFYDFVHVYFQTKKNKKYITNRFLLKYFNVSLDKIKKIPHQSRGKIYKDVYIEKNNYSDFLKIKVLAEEHIIQTYKNNALKLLAP